MTHEQQLQDLLATHAAELQRLVPAHLWPISPFKTEQFGPLTKYTLGEAEPGVWAMLHCLSSPDTGPAHDHPTRMDIVLIDGCYWELIFHEDGRTERVLRTVGAHHTVWPHTIHLITDLPQGKAWSLAFGHEVTRAWRHYPELIKPAQPFASMLSQNDS